MDALRFSLLNDFQRGFPLCARPYQELGDRLRVSEAVVIAELGRLRREGIVSRVGAIFQPGAVGASTLAAMSVPPGRLRVVSERVNRFPGVNHNYVREHDFNLWFVVAAPDSERLHALLAEIRSATRLEVLALPLIEEYHIDLGFDLKRRVDARPAPPATKPGIVLQPDAAEWSLLVALEEGLDLVSRPYATLGTRCGLSEAQVLGTLRRWEQAGIVRRLGVVVRHRELGYVANAMVVWDAPDELVGKLGRRLATEPEVTLCYRRRRAPPRWSFNLYCMIHGKDRAQVLAAIEKLSCDCGLHGMNREVLFSSARLKQRGPRHAVVEGLAHGTA